MMAICAIAACSFVRAQQTKHEFTLEQCVEYGMKNNAQVKNALLNIEIQQQINRGITSAALPQITGSTGVTDYLNIPTTLVPAQFFGGPAGSFEPVQFGTKYIANGTATLTQTLFDGQVFIGLKARSTSIALQTKNAEVTEESIKANIYKIYYQLVVSKTQVELLDANIQLLEKFKHDANEMFKNGFAEKLDVDKADVRLSNVLTEKQKALNSINVGYLGLKTLIGMPVSEVLVLTDKITDDDIKKDALADSLSYTDRKDFQAMQFTKKLNEFNIRRYKLAYIPVVSFNASYSKQAQRDKFDIFGSGDWFTTSYLGLNISIPIFDGFSKDSKIKQSRLELRQTQNNIDYLKLSIDHDAEQARLNFQSAITTMDYQKQNMQLAQNVYDQTKKKFESGLASNTDINAAQTDLKTAQTNYVSAMYDAIIAKVDYLKAIGKL
jgi:outer membrane protein TolC